jgi:hypothetical protein
LLHQFVQSVDSSAGIENVPNFFNILFSNDQLFHVVNGTDHINQAAVAPADSHPFLQFAHESYSNKYGPQLGLGPQPLLLLFFEGEHFLCFDCGEEGA